MLTGDIWFVRGTMKTYARRKNRVLGTDGYDYGSDYNYDGSRMKRIRMDERGMVCEEPIPLPSLLNEVTNTEVEDGTVSASSAAAMSSLSSSGPTSDPAVFSSDVVHDSSRSPASSPPPVSTRPSPRLTKTRKPAFSFLKRKRSLAMENNNEKDASEEALGDITEGTVNALKRPPGKKARLTQMQIDLGGDVRKACTGCGMDYILSNQEDVALHKAFHGLNIRGVDMGRGFAKEVNVVGRLGGKEVVAVVDGQSSLAVRNKVKRVLNVVAQELGAVEIADEVLWGKIAVVAKTKVRGRKKKGAVGVAGEEEKEDRFKIFVYLVGDKCTGLCLAERIRNAAKVVELGPAAGSVGGDAALATVRSSSIRIETTKDTALLGISRIWTSKSHRRKGIASALLSYARGNFFYGIEIPMELMAFSQPSESGGLLAETWFGEKTGWHVYSSG